MKTTKRFKRIRNTLLVLAVSVGMLVPSFTDPHIRAEAMPEVSLMPADGKSEVIYAKLAEDGSVTHVYAVNRLDPEGGEVVDYGDYRDIKPLTPDGEVKKAANGVTVQASDAPFYYQGELTRTELPWNFQMTYRLNDQVIAPKDLSGQSGELQLDLTIQHNDAVKDAEGKNPWAEGQMLQVTLTLPGDRVKDIEVTQGQMNQAGSNWVVTWIAMPQQAENSYRLKASIQDFYMPQMQLAAVPFAFDLKNMVQDLPDMSENQDFKDLKTGTSQLSDGAAELATGLDELENGLLALQDGLATLSTEGQTLVTGGSELSEGGTALTTGLTELSQGINTLKENGGSIVDGAQKSQEGAQALSEGLTQATTGIQQYTEGVKQYISGVQQLTGSIPTLDQGAASLLEGAGTFGDGLAQLANNTELSQASTSMLEAIQAMKAQLEALPSAEEQAAMSAGLTELQTQLPQLTQGSTQFKEGLAQIQTALTGLSTGANELYNGLGSVISNIQKSLEAQAAQTDEAKLAELMKATGLTQASLANPDVQALLKYMGEKEAASTAQMQQLLSGLKQLHSTGLPEQPGAAEALRAGLATLSSEFTQVVQRYEALDSGIQALGTKLQGLTQLAGMLEMASQLQGLDQYATFDQGLQTYLQGVRTVVAGYRNDETQEGLYHGIAQLRSGIQQLNQGATQLGTSGEALTETAALVSGQQQLATGAQELATGLTQLKEGLTNYTGGVGTLAEQMPTLESGVQTYVKGVQDYTSGISQYTSGVSQSHEGLTQIASGATQVKTGSHELADGTKQLDDGVDTMDERMATLIDQFISDMDPSDIPQPSFVSEHNRNVLNVQFVIMGEPIPKAEAPTPDVVAEEPKSVWDRFLDLFR